jgi:hypothetical protein
MRYMQVSSFSPFSYILDPCCIEPYRVRWSSTQFQRSNLLCWRSVKSAPRDILSISHNPFNPFSQQLMDVARRISIRVMISTPSYSSPAVSPYCLSPVKSFYFMHGVTSQQRPHPGDDRWFKLNMRSYQLRIYDFTRYICSARVILFPKWIFLNISLYQPIIAGLVGHCTLRLWI